MPVSRRHLTSSSHSTSDLAVAPVPVGEPLHPRHQARPLVSSEAFPVTGPRALPFAKVSGVAAMIDPLTWSQLQDTAVSGAERLPGRAGCFFATAIEGRFPSDVDALVRRLEDIRARNLTAQPRPRDQSRGIELGGR